jgi:hypothetical protein
MRSPTPSSSPSRTKGLDYRVGPLEGLWWADDLAEFGTGRKEN